MGANFNVYGDVHDSNKKITKVTEKGQSLTGYTLGLHLIKGQLLLSKMYLLDLAMRMLFG